MREAKRDRVAVVYPLHGQHKLSNEGYRTRDGHLIEWLGLFAAKHGSHVDVVSRPEPILVAPFRRTRGAVAAGTVPIESLSWAVPNVVDAKRWWVRSTQAYPKVDQFGDSPAITWNPFTATGPTSRNPFTNGRRVVFDLLDDWTIHYAFKSIRSAADLAYRRALDTSAVIFANSEGTLELAHRYGRFDARLMTNGVDPERFAVRPSASGPLTVGYVGKIGQRLDAQLIMDVCGAFPDLRFVFAGPFPDARDKYRKLLSTFSNVELLGDVHYEKVPALMATFDLGWVPHAVGDFEVGGDVIKTYEYRAAGLQVLTTPVIGAGLRFNEGVHVVTAQDQVEWIHEAINGRERMSRIPADIPDELTWQYKARLIAEALGIEFE